MTTYNVTVGNITRVLNGSRHFDHSLKVSTIFYGIQGFFSLIANFLVVLLFICRRKLLCNPHNRCILSLSVIDLLTWISILTSPTISVSEEMYKPKEHSGLAREFYCRILWNKFLPFALGLTSFYTSVVLSFERWLAVRRTIFYKVRFKTHHMNVLILVAWIAGFSSEVLMAFMVEGVYNETTENCRFTVAQSKTSSKIFSPILLLVQTVIPLTLIILAYIDVFRGIKTSLRFASYARAENVNSINRLKKVTKVAAITTIILVFSWLPCSLCFFVQLFVFRNPVWDAHDPLIVVGTLVIFSNSCINPCIYVFSNPELRSALRLVLR